jgi:hypothetical protein
MYSQTASKIIIQIPVPEIKHEAHIDKTSLILYKKESLNKNLYLTQYIQTFTHLVRVYSIYFKRIWIRRKFTEIKKNSFCLRAINSRSMRWMKHLARMRDMRNMYKILVEKPGGERPLRRQRRRWEDNIRMDLGEIGNEGVEWSHQAQDRDQWWDLLNTVMNLRAL